MEIKNIDELRDVLEQTRIEIPSLMINAQQTCTVLGITPKTLIEWTRLRLLINYGIDRPQYQLREVCELNTKGMRYMRFKDTAVVCKKQA